MLRTVSSRRRDACLIVARLSHTLPLQTILPALPSIHSKLESIVFTHSSVLGLSTPLDRKGPAIKDNGKLAFLGDAVLQCCVSDLLYRRFSSLKKGDLTMLRSHVVSNEQLARWATLYGFHERLRRTEGVTSLQLNPSDRIRATCLEAYIGATHLSLGLYPTQKWLLKLITTLPHLQATSGNIDLAHPPAGRESKELQPSDGNKIFVDEISLLFIEAARRKVPLEWAEYEETSQPNLSWRITLSIVGNTFEGVAPSKQAAKQVASAQALAGLGWREEEPMILDINDGA